MATFFPCARRPRFSGKKEGDVSEVLEAGSTLYAVRRSPARPTAKYLRQERQVKRNKIGSYARWAETAGGAAEGQY
jgi:hypothetical protein